MCYQDHFMLTIYYLIKSLFKRWPVRYTFPCFTTSFVCNPETSVSRNGYNLFWVMVPKSTSSKSKIKANSKIYKEKRFASKVAHLNFLENSQEILTLSIPDVAE